MPTKAMGAERMERKLIREVSEMMQSMGSNKGKGGKGRLLAGWWKGTFRLITVLGLLIGTMAAQVQLSFSVVEAPAKTSYIIVHALNPEGVEIASIEGMNPYSVPIYDGETLIGFSPYNAESYSRPIPISSGTHTIKAKFNGIVKEQTINLNPGEIKELTFTFKRTEFNFANVLDNIGGSYKNISQSGTKLPIHIKINDISSDPFQTGVWLSVYATKIDENADAKFAWKAKAEAKVVLNSRRFEINFQAEAEITEAINVYGSISVGASYMNSTSYPIFPINIPSNNNFINWYVQCIRDNWWPTILLGDDSHMEWHELFGSTAGTSTKGYQFTTLPASVNYSRMDCVPLFQPCKRYASISVNTSGNRFGSTQEHCEGTLDNLKFSSIPYDITGKGISSGPSPILPPTLIADIPTGIKIYTIGDENFYEVYGGDIAPQGLSMAFDIDRSPEKYGYKFLGNGTSTKEFYGRYAYYLIRGDAKIDAFEFLGTSRFWEGGTYAGALVASSNFWDAPCDQLPTEGGYPHNCEGPPDGKYSCLGCFVLLPGVDYIKPTTPTIEIIDAKMISPNELGIGVKVTFPKNAPKGVPTKVRFWANINGRDVQKEFPIMDSAPGAEWGTGISVDINGYVLPTTPLRINLADEGVPRFTENVKFELKGVAFYKGGVESKESVKEVQILLPVVVLHGYIHPFGYPLPWWMGGSWLSYEVAYKSLTEFLKAQGYEKDEK